MFGAPGLLHKLSKPQQQSYSMTEMCNKYSHTAFEIEYQFGNMYKNITFECATNKWP